MTRSISILGSTGSIGRSTVAVAQHLGIPVKALAANRSTDLLEQQARLLKPAFIAVYDEAAAKQLRISLGDTDIAIGSGMEALCEAATIGGADCVVAALSGAVGLKPTLAAIEKGRRIAFANKEVLVCAGSIVMRRAEECGALMLPMDSEHSAIFQCLGETGRRQLRRVLLTASGGPFYGRKRSETEHITPEQAVAHPNWSMGMKISVDSATMMNKGLEIIEAMHLFALRPEDIQVVIHRESIVHSMVEFVDGSVLAQLGITDMQLPIQYALTWPERRPGALPSLDLFACKDLSFHAPDFENFPCLSLAIECARRGGTAPAVLNAANEQAVSMFLSRKIGYNQIYDCVLSAVDSIDCINDPALEDILASDEAARRHVREVFS